MTATPARLNAALSRGVLSGYRLQCADPECSRRDIQHTGEGDEVRCGCGMVQYVRDLRRAERDDGVGRYG